MRIFMVDVVIARVILPIAGIGFVLWGFTGGGVGVAIVGALAVAVSVLFWRLPPERQFFGPDWRR